MYVAIGATAAGALVTAYATYKTADIGEFNRLAIKGKDWVNKVEKHSWKKDSRLATKDLTADAIKTLVVDKINPGYGDMGTKMNCRRATFAYEMRRRGNDVKATKSVVGTGQTSGGLLRAITKGDLDVPTTTVGIVRRLAAEGIDAQRGNVRDDVSLTKLFEGLDNIGNRNVIDLNQGDEGIFRTLSSQPNGARGELGVLWNAGGGHSMAWEVIKGKPVIIDAQNGKMFKNDVDFTKIAVNIKEVGFTRLDNVDLNDDYLMRWLKDA